MMWLGGLVTRTVQKSSSNTRGCRNCRGILVHTRFPIVPPLFSPLPCLCLPAPVLPPASFVQAKTSLCGWKKTACWSHIPGSLASVVFAAGQKTRGSSTRKGVSREPPQENAAAGVFRVSASLHKPKGAQNTGSLRYTHPCIGRIGRGDHLASIAGNIQKRHCLFKKEMCE